MYTELTKKPVSFLLKEAVKRMSFTSVDSCFKAWVATMENAVSLTFCLIHFIRAVRPRRSVHCFVTVLNRSILTYLLTYLVQLGHSYWTDIILCSFHPPPAGACTCTPIWQFSNILLAVQCSAWTEYKFACVCVSVTLSVNSPTGQTPQRIFTVDSLKDADLRKDVPFGVLMTNNHI